MKVGMLFKNLDAGGAESRTYELLSKMDKKNKNYIFYIFIYGEEKGSLYKKFLSLSNTNIICLKKENIIANLSLIKKLDVFISNLYLFSGVVMIILSLLGGPKRISYIRTYIKPKGLLNNIKYKFLKKLVILFSTNIICVSKSTCELNGFQKNKCEILYNGLDFDRISNQLKSNNRMVAYPPKKLLHIGRYTKAKNHSFIAEFFNRYHEFIEDSEILFIGKGVEENLAPKFKKEEIGKSVKFIEHVEDISSHVAGADLFLFPSVREGLPGALIEVASSNIPAIVSNIAPNREVREYYDNIITLPLDLNEWLTTSLRIEERELKYKEVEEFSMDNYMSKFIEIMER